MPLRTLREKANLFLYSSKERNLSILQYLSFVVSFGAIFLLIVYYGYRLDEDNRNLIYSIIRGTLIFYVLSYIIRFIYAFNPREYFSKTKFEGLLMLIILFDTLTMLFTGQSGLQMVFERVGIKNFKDYYIIFTQVYLLLIVGIDIGQVMKKLPRLGLEPSSLFILSFLVLIFTGSGLLMLPEMTASGLSMPFLDALFTSISACCITGLSVLDIGSYFSEKGQFMVMVLIQLGGLSIISFASFFALLSGGGFGLKQQLYFKDVLSAENLITGKSMVVRIIGISLFVEAIGSVIIYFLWPPDFYFANTGDKIFSSVFHSINSFNNAGFSLYTNGLMEGSLSRNYIMHLVVAIMIIAGGLGFPALRDLFGIDNLRTRMRLPWKQIHLGTKVVVYTSIALLAIGMLAFYLLERNNTMKDLAFSEQLITAFFQSATARSGGYATVDFGQIGTPMLIFFILLMFIGASPGSTGGGIKTTTFTLLMFSAWATIRGKRNLEMGRHFITSELLNRAYTIVFFASGIVFAGTFALTITDPEIPIMKLVFEEVSAFATVGLSTGITANISDAGKIVLMLSMFIGRIGILTLAFSLSRQVRSNRYKYPNAHIMVG